MKSSLLVDPYIRRVTKFVGTQEDRGRNSELLLEFLSSECFFMQSALRCQCPLVDLDYLEASKVDPPEA